MSLNSLEWDAAASNTRCKLSETVAIQRWIHNTICAVLHCSCRHTTTLQRRQQCCKLYYGGKWDD